MWAWAGGLRFWADGLLEEFHSELRQSVGRRLLLVGLGVAFLWTGFHAAHEALWSWRYFKVDPFALEAPVQWPAVGRHARTLAQDAEHLQPCLGPDRRLAIQAPDSWADQRFYLYMWLVYSLPEQVVLPLDEPDAASSADGFLSFRTDGSPAPDPPSSFGAAECDGERLGLALKTEPAP